MNYYDQTKLISSEIGFSPPPKKKKKVLHRKSDEYLLTQGKNILLKAAYYKGELYLLLSCNHFFKKLQTSGEYSSLNIH